MRRSDSHLFGRGSLSEFLRGRLQSAASEVFGLPEQTFLIASDEDLIEHVASQFRVEPLVLHEDARSMTQSEVNIDVAQDMNRYIRDRSAPFIVGGTRVIVSIPFGGLPDLWHLETSTYCGSYPQASVSRNGTQDGTLEVAVALPHDAAPVRFKAEFDRQFNLIRKHVQWSHDEVSSFNSGLPSAIETAIADRRSRLARHSGLADLLAIQLATDPAAPSVRPVQLQKRIAPPLPVPPKGGLKPEPGITEHDYENILSIIRHEGRSFETTPLTFAGLGEEALRNVVLAHLNGHYKGAATGETFRRKGKTDIHIPVDNRSAFVAECKLWKGAREVAGAVDQLLSYLTWRDSKSALVFFNTSVAAFSTLPRKLAEAIRAHPLFIRELPSTGLGEGRYEMRSAEDGGRRITVHAFLFNLYVSAA